MTHRFFARLHTSLPSTAAAVAARLRTAPQGGQGTVEYVALILLVAGVLAVAVAAAGSSKFDLAGTVTKNLKDAIDQVGSGGGGK